MFPAMVPPALKVATGAAKVLTVAGDACLHPFLQFERIGLLPRPVAMREHDLIGRQLGVESSRTLGELARLDLRIAKRDRLREFARSRSEEHTSGLQSLMRISYAVFCLKKKKIKIQKTRITNCDT